jgi:hypothetical protein
MSNTSKSPRRILLAAHELAKGVLPEYSHLYSLKKFTLPQLFACLVLKASLKLDYRGVAGLLDDSPDLQNAIGLKQAPHFTTLQKGAPRLLKIPVVEKLLARSIRLHSPRRKRVKVAAIDSTGLESHHCSRFFVKRRSRVENLWQTTTYRRYPKLGIVCDVATHLILAIHLARGPTPDTHQLKLPMWKAWNVIPIRTLLADAGYDSESNHHYCRDVLDVITIIPPHHGRPTQKPAKGRYRRLMQTRFQRKQYGQRWQVETVMSMLKRRQGDATSGRSHHSRRRDMMLMAITHNVMIL